MTDILLISDTLENINVAWRHFRYKEYNSNATMNVDTAMEFLKSDKPPQVVIYYWSSDSSGFFPFYRILRSDEKTAEYPLLVLTDVELQKPLAEYVKLENTQVLGISINDTKLMDVIRAAARGKNKEEQKTGFKIPPIKKPKSLR